MRFRRLPTLSCCLLLAACSTPRVTSLTLLAPTTTLTVGQTIELGVDMKGDGGYSPLVLVTSSNENIVKLELSDNLSVEAISPGEATITATSAMNPEVKDSVILTVVSNKPAALPSGGMLAARVTSPVSPRDLTFEVDVFVVDKDSKPVNSLLPSAFDIADAPSSSGTFFSFEQSCRIFR